MDDANFEVSMRTCPRCGRRWLRAFTESEAFGRSGRWVQGPVPAGTAVSANHARTFLAGLDTYFCGGSACDGRVGRASGEIR